MLNRFLPASAIAVIAAVAVQLSTTSLDAENAQSTGAPRVLNVFFSNNGGIPIPPDATFDGLSVHDGPTAVATLATRKLMSSIDAPTVASQWVPIAHVVDTDGTTHTKLQQRISGLRVFGAELAVHLANGSTPIGLNGEALLDANLSTQPLLDGNAADKAARAALSLDPSSQLKSSELLIYNPAIVGDGPSTNHIAYHLVLASQDDTESTRALIDARSGKLLAAYSNLESSLNREIRDLAETIALPGPICREQSGAGPVNAVSASPECLAAFQFTGDVYNYFRTAFGRESWDGAGATMVSSLRYGTAANAFWSGSQAVFGPGFATKDVMAHEWTHAVTGTTARLLYLNQAGALSESFSDIFAAMIDSDDWLIGEELPRGVVRSLADPRAMGQPSKVSDPEFYCGTDDNGGVHRNSGVLNHAAYLIAEGGSFNGLTVVPQGRTNTARIFYRALTTYLTEASTFLDAYNALNASCSDMFGAASASCVAVANGLHAVELNSTSSCRPIGASTPDGFEDDDSSALARNYTAEQQHTFHDAGDADWVRVTATAGTPMRFETSDLDSSADTVLRLYGPNAVTLLAEDDDGGGHLASRVDYTFTTGGTCDANTAYVVRMTSLTVNTSGETTPRNVPLNLRFSARGSTVALAWDAPSAGNVSDYYLEAGSSPGLTDIASQPIGDRLSLSVGGVPDGVYYVRVRGRQSVGVLGPPSNEIRIIVGSAEPPGAPTAFHALVAGRSVTLSWSAPTGGGSATNYVLDVGSAPGLSDLTQRTLAVGTTSFNANDVPAGTYYIRLRAVNRAGSSAASAEVVALVR
jgi:Zn-dependent metalloprotease